MSAIDLARRTCVKLEFEGVDISPEIEKYLISISYVDNEEDKADDIQITLDDREGIWLGNWLKGSASETGDNSTQLFMIGDEVIVNGTPMYSSYGSGSPSEVVTDYRGEITRLNFEQNASYPIHVDTLGWFGESQISLVNSEPSTMTTTGGAKGSKLGVMLIQKNWHSDGSDKVLDCGTFQVDNVECGGPPDKVTIKATSLPYTSTIRKQEKTKAWESIYLKSIAQEIASKNGLKLFFESNYNPFYERREQVQQSDVVFLKELCGESGQSLKVTTGTIVIFEQQLYEAQDAVREIRRGTSDVLSYRFSTNFNDTAYDKCHVSYTDPTSGETIEYTYKPRKPPGSGLTLEINEKVLSREEARTLAMKRLRQKNKKEFEAAFTLVGDLDLVAGVTVDVIDYGAFDGKYIIATASQRVTGGHKVELKMRKVLEDY